MSTVDLKVSDGTSMKAYVANPKQANSSGVIVLQEAFGVDKHIREVTDKLAGQGYLSIAPELFHRSAPPGFEAAYDAFDKVMPIIEGMTLPTIEADIRASYDWLLENGVKKVATLGFCLGGRASYFANSFLPLKGAISFYGGRIVPDLLPLAAKQNGPLILFWGGLDKHIGTTQPRAIADALLNEGKIFSDVLFSNADHGFFNVDKKVYNSQAASEAWAMVVEFLKNKFA